MLPWKTREHVQRRRQGHPSGLQYPGQAGIWRLVSLIIRYPVHRLLKMMTLKLSEIALRTGGFHISIVDASPLMRMTGYSEPDCLNARCTSSTGTVVTGLKFTTQSLLSCLLYLFGTGASMGGRICFLARRLHPPLFHPVAAEYLFLTAHDSLGDLISNKCSSIPEGDRPVEFVSIFRHRHCMDHFPLKIHQGNDGIHDADNTIVRKSSCLAARLMTARARLNVEYGFHARQVHRRDHGIDIYVVPYPGARMTRITSCMARCVPTLTMLLRITGKECIGLSKRLSTWRSVVGREWRGLHLQLFLGKEG